jgi:hypothetical protein
MTNSKGTTQCTRPDSRKDIVIQVLAKGINECEDDGDVYKLIRMEAEERKSIK